ncbi:MAG: cofactor-independent phosphoglycerate mutase [Thermodesulfobacteriota bacterium]
MKYAVLIGDGMGDYPLAELKGRTILEAAATPNLDALAQGGLLGLVQTIPETKESGSDVANMAIMGYDPAIYHTGRGPLEAASLGVRLEQTDLAFRLNLVTLEFAGSKTFMRDHSAGHIGTDEAHILLEHLAATLPLNAGQKLYPGVSYRHLLVWPRLPADLPTIPPHDWRDKEVSWHLANGDRNLAPVLDLVKASWPILADHPVNQKRRRSGLKPANSIWPWGQGRPPAMSAYKERFGLTGAVVSAVDLIKGLGVYAGLKPLDVPGATGYLDTNCEGKVQAALTALQDDDFVLLHLEAPDEAGHQGDWKAKLAAIEMFDHRVVGPIWAGLKEMGEFRLLVLCDHYTPVTVKTHTREPVPFLVYPGPRPSGRPFTEKEASCSGLYLPHGHLLVGLLFGSRG